jgi:hypothetical protein
MRANPGRWLAVRSAPERQLCDPTRHGHRRQLPGRGDPTAPRFQGCSPHSQAERKYQDAEAAPEARGTAAGSPELAVALLATPALLQPPHQPRSRLLASPPVLGAPLLARALGMGGARPVVVPVMRR